MGGKGRSYGAMNTSYLSDQRYPITTNIYKEQQAAAYQDCANLRQVSLNLVIGQLGHKWFYKKNHSELLVINFLATIQYNE